MKLIYLGEKKHRKTFTLYIFSLQVIHSDRVIRMHRVLIILASTTLAKFPHFTRGHQGWTGKDGSPPPPWVPLLKSYGSSILSTSLGSKT